ncbi:GNAT family N-acetyltransferase [Pseudomonas sp. PSKL.D1]|uniref:GNAT family N-acetyltransferase n=1 Tax=Pseudomonas sp. PSKL.D1 TaxID=3029060 RepID=UPI0023812A5F|nr:GNAT family N-acetyltransferase [Pseudomonas sp. PSKL.D1]WDY55842.1 GNAT family N-acetyltransferase [Pseudomonas sp. PSKL.D1]
MTDLPAIYQGEAHYIRTWEPDHEAAWRCQLERHLTRWVEHFDRFTIAVIGERFAGYALWAPEHDHAELCTLGVSQDKRRRGVGTALLNAYLMETAQQGFTRLRLSVRPDNPARFMYLKAGFSCVGTAANNYLIYERLR